MNCIEIEKKYLIKDPNTFEEIEALIMSSKSYSLLSSNIKLQTDYYYDSPDYILLKEGKGLRFRHVSNKTLITIKGPLGDGLQDERFEYEAEVSSPDIASNKQTIIKYLPEFENTSPNKTLTVLSKKKKINISKAGVQFELSFDDVMYKNDLGQEAHDYQVEIELKSPYEHKKELEVLSSFLEKNIGDLRATNKSKYELGIEKTTL